MRLSIIAILPLLLAASCASHEFTREKDMDAHENPELLQQVMSEAEFDLIEGQEIGLDKQKVNTADKAFELGLAQFTADFGSDDSVHSRRFTTDYLFGYWVVKGLLPEGFTGGRLVVVIDAATGEFVCPAEGQCTFQWR